VFELKEINESVLSAVQRLKGKDFTVEGNKIVVDVADPAEENPGLVRAIVSAGGEIQFTTQLNPDLQETYLRLMEETK
jgi:hypothetical protein